MLRLSNFLWQKDEQRPHQFPRLRFSVPPALVPLVRPCFLRLLLWDTAPTESGEEALGTEEKQLWREEGGVGSTLEAPLCKPGQPAAPGVTGPGPGASESPPGVHHQLLQTTLASCGPMETVPLWGVWWESESLITS